MNIENSFGDPHSLGFPVVFLYLEQFQPFICCHKESLACFNSLWLSGAIWRHRTRSAFDLVTACYLTVNITFMRPKHLADDIFSLIFLYENCYILIQTLLTFGPVNDMLGLV